MFKIENFVSPRAMETIQKAGLHKIAGVMAGVDEITVKTAAQIIGTKARLRRSEFKKIAEGIQALDIVTGG